MNAHAPIPDHQEQTRRDRRRLSVVIINYRQPALTIECLGTLERQLTAQQNCGVVVVDNDSGDGSADRLESEIRTRGWSTWVELVRAPRNGGFSYGNNVGMKHRPSDAYLLLNSDAFVQEGAICSLLQALEERPDAGLISPRLLLPDGSLHVSCYRFQSPINSLMHAAQTRLLAPLKRYETVLPHPDHPTEPQWTSFACVLIRDKALQEVGYMDEGFFMYFEDQDYCRRLWEHGWKVVNWPNAVVVHHQGGSGPVRESLRLKKRPPKYYYASRSRYLAKYYGVLGLWISNLLWVLGRGISLPKEVLFRRRSHICECEWRDIWTSSTGQFAATSVGGK